jgi:hypothetical protein
MKLRKNRFTEREAMNAVRSFFEENGCVFQEVDTGNDYGKDAYVDFVDDDETVTGICIALQIKGGVSYRRGDGYGIPLDLNHFETWRNSSLPIIGVVYDPEDAKIRWCNISDFLNSLKDEIPSYIPIDADSVLTPATLTLELRSSLDRFTRLNIEHPIIKLCSASENSQLNALYDCFALGRSDARILIELRYLTKMLTDKALYLAIEILAHLTPHPDILWNETNWIPDDVKKSVRSHLVWEEQEIWRMLSFVTWEHWERGDYGESLYMLLLEDSEIKNKVENVAFAAIDAGDEEVAFIAFYLTIYWAGSNGSKKYQEMVLARQEFGGFYLLNEIEQTLQDFGQVWLFE